MAGRPIAFLAVAACEPVHMPASIFLLRPGARILSPCGPFAVSQPDEVDMNQILFRPTAREY
ncbi:hypothetical protein X735_21040 [Mesorhizobium sp. L2C085B000]|nr:hypothetical protein X735_21040 [Mesorhizobium sp. L2C085B000]